MGEFHHVELLLSVQKNIDLSKREVFEYTKLNTDIRAEELLAELNTLSERVSNLIKDRPIKKVVGYGFCPQCGAKGVSRERRINGNDTCINGHIYPSRNAH